MSPAWMIRSAPRIAAIASGRRRPCVSEMTPMITTRRSVSVPVADALERLALLPVLEVPLLAPQRLHLPDQPDHAAHRNDHDDDQHRQRHDSSLNFRPPECQTPSAMPELPDLVHVEAGLRAAVVGKRISAARTGDPTVLRVMVTEPFPTVMVG